MTSYSFEIAYSWWIFVVSVLAVTGFTIYSYRFTVPPISFAKKLTLIILRSLALSLLLLLLLEPVVKSTTVTEEPPQIAFLLDKSESMHITDASVNRKKLYSSLLQSLAEQPAQIQGNSQTVQFDKSVQMYDSLHPHIDSADGQATNIAQAIQEITYDADKENIRAVVLISDGSVNDGQNPLYNAEMLARPMYVVGIGDSTLPKDIEVESVITNEIAYVDTEVPINIRFRSAGYTSGEVTLSLLDNGKVAETRTIVLRDGEQAYSEIFTLTPTVPGTRKITAVIEPLEGELTDKNNQASVFLRVLKKKRKIVLFAGAPSSDVSFIRSVFSNNKNVEIASFIQKKGGTFFKDIEPKTLSEAEAIMLVGFPNIYTPATVLDQIARQLQRGKPMLFVASKQTDYNKLRQLEEYLPFLITQSSPQELLVAPDVTAQGLAHPSMKLTGADTDSISWNRLPPIFRTETFVRTKPEATVLSTIRVNSTALPEPLILSAKFQRRRVIAVLGYGLYRWKMLGYALETYKGRETTDIFSTFIKQSVQWLTTERQGKQVRIRTSESFYADGETVEILGQVYDESFNPLEDARVSVSVQSASDSVKRDIDLVNIGGGRYRATVEGLLAGEYSFNGKALYKNSTVGRDEGRFSIGELNIEFQNPRMNAQLLRLLAERTGGRLYIPDTTQASVASSMEALFRDIQSQPQFTPRQVQNKENFLLWTVIWILSVVVVLFALEWFLRKKSGLV